MSDKLENGFIIFTKNEVNKLTKVGPKAIAMYFHLKKRINHLRGDNIAYPGGKTLLKELGFSSRSKNTLVNITKELEDIGLIKVVREYNPETRVWRVNKYCLIYGVGAEGTTGVEQYSTRVVQQEHHNEYELNEHELNQDLKDLKSTTQAKAFAD